MTSNPQPKLLFLLLLLPLARSPLLEGAERIHDQRRSGLLLAYLSLRHQANHGARDNLGAESRFLEGLIREGGFLPETALGAFGIRIDDANRAGQALRRLDHATRGGIPAGFSPLSLTPPLVALYADSPEDGAHAAALLGRWLSTAPDAEAASVTTFYLLAELLTTATTPRRDRLGAAIAHCPDPQLAYRLGIVHLADWDDLSPTASPSGILERAVRLWLGGEAWEVLDQRAQRFGLPRASRELALCLLAAERGLLHIPPEERWQGAGVGQLREWRRDLLALMELGVILSVPAPAVVEERLALAAAQSGTPLVKEQSSVPRPIRPPLPRRPSRLPGVEAPRLPELPEL